MKILIIEDECKLAASLAEGLQQNGYAVVVAHTGEAGLKMLYEGDTDLLILDLMLPKMNGLSVLRELRRGGHLIPVMILTARDSVEDRVLGLDVGADDYLVKPFAFPELLARIRSLQRRGQHAAVFQMRLSDLGVDLNGRTATRDESDTGSHQPRIRSSGIFSDQSGNGCITRDVGPRCMERNYALYLFG